MPDTPLTVWNQVTPAIGAPQAVFRTWRRIPRDARSPARCGWLAVCRKPVPAFRRGTCFAALGRRGAAGKRKGGMTWHGPGVRQPSFRKRKESGPGRAWRRPRARLAGRGLTSTVYGFPLRRVCRQGIVYNVFRRLQVWGCRCGVWQRLFIRLSRRIRYGDRTFVRTNATPNSPGKRSGSPDPRVSAGRSAGAS